MAKEGYRKRLEEHQRREKELRDALASDRPYDPSQMKSRVPLGCVVFAFAGIWLIGYLIYRYIKLHGI